MLASIIKLIFRRREDKKKKPQPPTRPEPVEEESWENTCSLSDEKRKHTQQPSLEERLCALEAHMAEVKEGTPEWEKLNARRHILHQQWEKKNSPDGLSREQRRRHRVSQEEHIRRSREED